MIIHNYDAAHAYLHHPTQHLPLKKILRDPTRHLPLKKTIREFTALFIY